MTHIQILQTHDGGARRDRTDDLRLAKPALSQLSYGPSNTMAPNFLPLTDGIERRTIGFTLHRGSKK